MMTAVFELGTLSEQVTMFYSKSDGDWKGGGGW